MMSLVEMLDVEFNIEYIFRQRSSFFVIDDSLI